MNILNFTHPTAVATQVFDSLDKVMGSTDLYDFGDVQLRRTSGKVASLSIRSYLGNIDLSQDPTGDLVDGILYPRIDAPHDDERDFVLGRPRQFPETEEDLRFIDSVVKAIEDRNTEQS